MVEDMEGVTVGASVADGNNLVVEDSLAVLVIIKSEGDMLTLLGFDEETVRSEAVKAELIVAKLFLSATEDFALTVTEVGDSVTLGNVVMVASGGSMVLSDSGVAMIVVLEFLLVVVCITEAVGEAVVSSVLSEALELIVLI